MKAKVFSREDQEFKEVKITAPEKREISDEILSKRQNMINITADIIGVSAALIMRINPESIEVFLKSQNEDNPYSAGDIDALGHGHYCETTIAQKEEFYIKNALKNEKWEDNPDVDLGMISYYGLPICWPDDEIFGTICILNDTEIILNKNHKRLCRELKNVIEEDLNLIFTQSKSKTFFDINLDLLCIANTEGEFVKVNSAWEDILGYNAKELENMNCLDFVHPDDLDSTKQVIKKLKNNEKITNFTNRLKDKTGDYHFIEWNSKANGNYIYAVARDITSKREQLTKLEFQYKFQKKLTEISSSLLDINSFNIDQKINKSLEKVGEFFDIDRSYIFELSKENENISGIYEWCREGIEIQKDNLQNLKINNFSWVMEKLYNNEIIYIKDIKNMNSKAETEKKLFEQQNIKSLVIIPIYIDNELFGFLRFDSVKNNKEFNENEIRLLKLFTDVIKNAISKHINDKKIMNLTYKDALTGLYNRRFFEKELERLDTQRQLPISIIVADINGLKIINDSLGHKKGDQLLIKTAEIFKEVIREEDILARQGGDEFAILLPQTGKTEAEKIINRIKKKMTKTNDDQLTVSIALGVAVKKDLNQSINEILKLADAKMYQNKLSESRNTKSNIVQSLINTLVAKSNETKEHILRITKLASDFGEKLDLNNSQLHRLSLLAALHDIGKITIPEDILKKQEPLTVEEWEIVKDHSERGYKIASSSQEFAVIADDILAHHESWDGIGYPRKLEGEEIPYLARMFSIIDNYDVMTHDRPYKKAISKEEALREIDSCSGSKFDPELAKTFIEMMENK